MREACLIVLAAVAWGCSVPAVKQSGTDDSTDIADNTAPDPLTLQPLYTEHLGQLTSTVRNPIDAIGMRGTDLGSSFERDGGNVFLFGDTLAIDQASSDQDSAALGPLSLPVDGSMPSLSWLTQGSRFTPLLASGIALGRMNVPVEGMAAGDTTYIFFATQFDFTAGSWKHSTLAHAAGMNLGALTVDHDVASAKFLNVSVVQDGADAWIFGSGAYRKSAVYLAKAPTARIADRGAWQYVGAGGALVPDEASAAPVVEAGCVGELSVRRHPKLGVYMMTYNCDAPRGIILRLAGSPAGPWTDGRLIFDPGVRGYQYFMHAKESAVGHDDGLSQVGNEEDWGGEYAPYLVPSWSSDGPPGVFAIVYTLSSWNPYQVHLMRTWLGAPGTTYTPPVKGADLPKASLVNGEFANGSLTGWQSSGDAFVTYKDSNGAWRVSTYTADKADGATGLLWQDFTVDTSTKELAFFIHGGDGRVTLTRGADVVRSSHGRRTNDIETAVVWQLEEYRGETVRLAIEDDLTTPWGFVGARGFVLR